MPDRARQVSANYMHLMEQPTVFYAVCLSLHFLGYGADPVNLGLAWGYVGLRVLHSLVHTTFNDVRLRFALFLASGAALIALTVRAALGMLGL
jgi:hypothetical protein